MKFLKTSVLVIVILMSNTMVACSSEFGVSRTNVRSPQFFVTENDVDFFMTHSGYRYTNRATGEGERFYKPTIYPKAFEMIRDAEKMIIFSAFLFDNVYSGNEPDVDIVKRITDALIEKKKEFPSMTIAVILDPSHKNYAERMSPAEKRLLENGVDVFYSDMLEGLKSGLFLNPREAWGHVSRILHYATFGLWGNVGNAIFNHIPFPAPIKLNNEQISMTTAFDGMLAKVNHRKLLVTDIQGDGFEALISSANPHNDSYFSTNAALSVKGEPAKYIYRVLREDIKHSIGIGRHFVRWAHDRTKSYKKNYLTDSLPALGIKVPQQNSNFPVGVEFVTEKEIGRAILRILEDVERGDEVRLQMFYLSYRPIITAILKASEVVDKPIRILLDANKDSFNKVKDGTPNRQTAKLLLKEAEKRGGKIEIRWYSTHGEQNHAKIMSVTNSGENKQLLINGSANWTGRNTNGVNMESNLIVRGAVDINNEFNEFFDLFWTNSDGNEYSLDYSAFSESAGKVKWILGDKPFYYSSY